MKIGLLKYNVKPPNSVIKIPLNKGTRGILLSRRYIIISETNVAKMKGGIAILRLSPL